MPAVASNVVSERLDSEAQLDEFLTRPRPELIEFVQRLRGPLLLLGAGGKMGPSLAVLARRAADAAGHPLKIIAASRFSNPQTRRWLDEHGVSTISCDLLNRDAFRRLPDAAEVISLVGMKFGTTEKPAQTWATNVLVPSLVIERYASSRVVALSTGNVYPLSVTARGGSIESDPLTPLGEYSNAAVGRERIFEYLAEKTGTALVLLRLFYAVELRYGVIRDIADQIWSGKPVSVANGSFNCIWQGDANELIVRSLGLALTTPQAFNLTSRDIYQVRTVAQQLAELMGRPVRFIGQESDTALVGDTAKIRALLGEPATTLESVLNWTASWVKSGGRNLGKPTHFEVRDGAY